MVVTRKEKFMLYSDFTDCKHTVDNDVAVLAAKYTVNYLCWTGIGQLIT